MAVESYNHSFQQLGGRQRSKCVFCTDMCQAENPILTLVVPPSFGIQIL